MFNLISLLSQYEILERVSSYVSTLDLFHLACASSNIHDLILRSKPLFKQLTRLSLCDGQGLKARQDFTGLYALRAREFVWGKGRKAHNDEELEVRVWNRTCDAASALPCSKCNINICEECRYVPRVRDQPYGRANQRPHLIPSWQTINTICYCSSCDEKVQRELPLTLSDYCDCDAYTRWICMPCRVQEFEEDGQYLDSRTKSSFDYEESPKEGLWLYDHQGERAFWCPCGVRVPEGIVDRCSWCKRRHDRDSLQLEDPFLIPSFDEDPCYPKIVWDAYGDTVMYPPLAYAGPIYQQEANQSGI